jgi:hypothetical protein
VVDVLPYSIAMECNHDEDTYAPEDLFDKLDTIRVLKVDGMSQVEIGTLIDFDSTQTSRHLKIINKLPIILDLARHHQEGRGNEDLPNGNFNFTEGWFRNSGLYELKAKFHIPTTIDDKQSIHTYL